jgi:hypothetical protein
MPRFTQNLFAALASVLIVTVAMAEVVTVPPTQAAMTVVAPALA